MKPHFSLFVYLAEAEGVRASASPAKGFLALAVDVGAARTGHLADPLVTEVAFDKAQLEHLTFLGFFLKLVAGFVFVPRHLARHAGLGSTFKASVLDRAWLKESLSIAVSTRAVLVVRANSIQNIFLPSSQGHGIDLGLVIILKEFVAVFLCEFFNTVICWTFNLCYCFGNE